MLLEKILGLWFLLFKLLLEVLIMDTPNLMATAEPEALPKLEIKLA